MARMVASVLLLCIRNLTIGNWQARSASDHWPLEQLRVSNCYPDRKAAEPLDQTRVGAPHAALRLVIEDELAWFRVCGRVGYVRSTSVTRPTL